jgi:hypothetical protein
MQTQASYTEFSQRNEYWNLQRIDTFETRQDAGAGRADQ